MQETSSLGGFLGILYRRKRFLVIASVLIALAAAVVSLLLPKKYPASLTILPAETESSSPLAALLAQGAAALVPFDLFGGGAAAEIQREILSSFTVRQRVVEGLDLYRAFDLERKRADSPAAALWAATTKLQEAMRLEILEPSGLLRLTVVSKDPELSVNIAQRLFAELERFNREVAQEGGRRKRAFLEQRLTESAQELARAESAFTRFSREHGIVHLPAELEAEMALAAELQQRLVLKELERAVLAQDAGDKAPALRALDAEIGVLRGKLRQMESGGEEGVGFQRAMKELPSLALTYYRLQRDLTIQQEIQALLIQQAEQARLQENNDVPTLRLLDPPQRSVLPAWPRKKLIVGGATLLGFALLCLFVLAQDFWRRVRADASGRYASWAWLPGLAAREKRH